VGGAGDGCGADEGVGGVKVGGVHFGGVGVGGGVGDFFDAGVLRHSWCEGAVKALGGLRRLCGVCWKSSKEILCKCVAQS